MHIFPIINVVGIEVKCFKSYSVLEPSVSWYINVASVQQIWVQSSLITASAVILTWYVNCVHSHERAQHTVHQNCDKPTGSRVESVTDTRSLDLKYCLGSSYGIRVWNLGQKWFLYEIKSVCSEHLQTTATQRRVQAGPSLCGYIYGLIARWQRDQKGFWTTTRHGCHVPKGKKFSSPTFSGRMLLLHIYWCVWSNIVHTRVVLIPKAKLESCDRKPEEHVWSCLPGEYRISRFYFCPIGNLVCFSLCTHDRLLLHSSQP